MKKCLVDREISKFRFIDAYINLKFGSTKFTMYANVQELSDYTPVAIFRRPTSRTMIYPG